MKVTVADIAEILDAIAPVALAERWDNVGLQIGKRDWPVRSVRVALDPLPEVVADACKHDIDLLITHHPLIFKPLHALDFDTPIGYILRKAVEHKMAIYTAHTNLDITRGGVNDVLAERIGLKNIKVLSGTLNRDMVKLVMHVPVRLEKKLLDLLLELTREPVEVAAGGSFRMDKIKVLQVSSKDSNQALRATGDIQLRIEVTAVKDGIGRILGEIRKDRELVNSSCDLYPLLPSDEQEGLGRVGDLDSGMDFSGFIRLVKRKLDLVSVKVAGNADIAVYRVAVCAGSGSSLLDAFLDCGAQVFLSGDLRYHDARTVEAAGRGLIDIGHFKSEHLMVGVLADLLHHRLQQLGATVEVEACGLEKDPFMII
ncbi:MAG: Nif3-like dinuclear metal center hexameric protein [Deltaproteobacteria bacterium]|nr:Nif3-like dinuclear metal center hexameric protein [Deltaproteobacteria bacterium]MBW1992828.1 Nif3-like dinuclear metal center hexameric protein [Deltaproteobacteria bacterium]MBW2150916.1 Nif3-like dinuclear metal center hexameric protein [Deltaproteobacteria bacterium]